MPLPTQLLPSSTLQHSFNGTLSQSQKSNSSHNTQAAYVLITPLTGLGAPQGFAGWHSGVFAAEIPKLSSGWDPQTL